MRGIFVTGTDTGVGKTLVTATLLRYLRVQGINAAPMKPVQTGALADDDGRLMPADLAVHLAAAQLTPTREERDCMGPYAYEMACSPHLAGRITGRYPDLARITVCAERLLERYDFLVIEGAGGIMVPINEHALMIDLMRVFDFPVLLVARAGLGTINHSLLSLHALRSAGLHVMGIVFNDSPPESNPDISRDNPLVIAEFGEIEVFGTLSDQPDLNDDTTPDWTKLERELTGLPMLLDYARG